MPDREPKVYSPIPGQPGARCRQQGCRTPCWFSNYYLRLKNYVVFKSESRCCLYSYIETCLAFRCFLSLSYVIHSGSTRWIESGVQCIQLPVGCLPILFIMSCVSCPEILSLPSSYTNMFTNFVKVSSGVIYVPVLLPYFLHLFLDDLLSRLLMFVDWVLVWSVCLHFQFL